MNKSPLAPAFFPSLEPVAGVELSTCAAEIKYKEREDMLLVKFCPDTQVAGVFTQSLSASSPVLLARESLKLGKARALLVNAGNANAFTGKLGDAHCALCRDAVAVQIDCQSEDVFLASTGVIGEPLPINKILRAIPQLKSLLSDNAWQQAAAAIVTTDTFSKGAQVQVDIAGSLVSINGIAKGSGMIAPDMATMLAFIFTDAKLPASILQAVLEEVNQVSFNAITVDSDTSTSDTCLLFATGQTAHVEPKDVNDTVLDNFKKGLNQLMIDLAQQVVRDGEGASKFIEMTVTGAENNQAAKIVAMSVANSPLVKTAIAGEDANWGRVVMAVGKAGQKADRDKLKIKMGNCLITDNGQVVDDYDEQQVTAHLAQKEIKIEVDLGVGSGAFTVWTCDLTHDYININATYRS